MSARTLSVAVAVTAITGTEGYSDLKNESCLNEGRKSWPHSSRMLVRNSLTEGAPPKP